MKMKKLKMMNPNLFSQLLKLPNSQKVSKASKASTPPPKSAVQTNPTMTLTKMRRTMMMMKMSTQLGKNLHINPQNRKKVTWVTNSPYYRISNRRTFFQ